MELVHQMGFVAGVATLVASISLVGAAFAAGRDAVDGRMARAGRWWACFVIAVALAGSFAVRLTTRDWVHFQWSLGYPLLGAFCVSGAFLPWMWPSERPNAVAASPTSKEWTRSGWWFPAAALAIAAASVVLQALLPGEVPAVRNSPGPIVGTIQIAAFGLGLGELPAWLQVRFPHDAARGMDHLSRDLTVPVSVMTLAAETLCAYVALAIVLRVVRGAALRYRFQLVAPIAVTGGLFLRWRRLVHGLWQETPSEIRAFGPTLAIAAVALAVLTVLWLRDSARAAT